MRIFDAYDQSGASGAALARKVVSEARQATSSLADSLRATTRNVWRYPVLIAAGMEDLGLKPTGAGPAVMSIDAKLGWLYVAAESGI